MSAYVNPHLIKYKVFRQLIKKNEAIIDLIQLTTVLFPYEECLLSCR